MATQDWIGRVVERWSAVASELDFEPYLVTGRISRIATHLARRQGEVFARYGLNRGEVGVLSTLRIAGPPHRLSPTKLFKGLMLSSAGMTGLLDRLQERGLVTRSSDPGDRRGVVIDLTGKGRELIEVVVAANTQEERELVAGLTSEEVASLAALLQRVLSMLEDGSGALDR